MSITAMLNVAYKYVRYCLQLKIILKMYLIDKEEVTL